MRKWIRNAGAVLLSFVIATSSVRAAEDTVTLTAEENKVEAVLIQKIVEAGMAEEICSLQLSFQIEAKQGKLKQDEVSFEFGSSVESAVEQYRYQPDTGILSIYISGSSDILSGSSGKGAEGITLGNVVINPPSDTAGVYIVKVKENSLKVVNGAFYMDDPPLYAQTEEQVRLGNAESNVGGDENESESTGGSGGSNSGSGDKYFDDWYNDGDSERVPIVNNSSNRAPGIHTTSNNPAPGKENTIPETAIQINNSQNPPSNVEPGNQQTESAPSELSPGVAGTDASGLKPGSESAGDSSGDSGNHAGEQVGNLEGSITVQPETGKDGETITDLQNQKDTSVSAQPDQEDTEHETRKAHTWSFMLAVLAAVIVAAAVVAVLIRKDPNKDTNKK